MKLNIGLDNTDLYNGCTITEVGGRLTLTTPIPIASNIIGKNATSIIDKIPPSDRNELILTGPMAVWAYLVVFHVVLHKFNQIFYDDGRNDKILIAQH